MLFVIILVFGAGFLSCGITGILIRKDQLEGTILAIGGLIALAIISRSCPW